MCAISCQKFKCVWVQDAGPDPTVSLCNYVLWSIINFVKYEICKILNTLVPRVSDGGFGAAALGYTFFFLKVGTRVYFKPAF